MIRLNSLGLDLSYIGRSVFHLGGLSFVVIARCIRWRLLDAGAPRICFCIAHRIGKLKINEHTTVS